MFDEYELFVYMRDRSRAKKLVCEQTLHTYKNHNFLGYIAFSELFKQSWGFRYQNGDIEMRIAKAHEKPDFYNMVVQVNDSYTVFLKEYNSVPYYVCFNTKDLILFIECNKRINNDIGIVVANWYADFLRKKLLSINPKWRSRFLVRDFHIKEGEPIWEKLLCIMAKYIEYKSKKVKLNDCKLL